jgi:hypothetical protein
MMGDVGSGKTSFVMTLGSSLELIDVDGNCRTALGIEDQWTEARSEVEVFEVSEVYGKKPTSFRSVDKRVKEIAQEVSRGEYPQIAVCVDSLTSLAEAAMAYVQDQNGNTGSSPTQQEWGSMARAVEQVVLTLRSLPIATFLIAHDELVDVNEETQIRLGVPGKALGKSLPKKFSDMWYLKTSVRAGGKNEFEVFTAPKGAIKARSSAAVPNPYDASKGLGPLLKEMGYPSSG